MNPMQIKAAALIFAVLIAVIGINAMPEKVFFAPYTQSDDNGKGTWGSMLIKTDRFGRESFSFSGHKLEPNTEYRIIRMDLADGTGNSVCLASGLSNNAGGIKLDGNLRSGGPEFIVALKSDINCGGPMVNWQPERYLFSIQG